MEEFYLVCIECLLATSDQKNIDHEKFKTNNLIAEKEIKTDNIFRKNLKILNLNFHMKKIRKIIIRNFAKLKSRYKGDKVGIIGKSGSGKSTLVDLIIGFLDPSWKDLYR